MLRAVIKNIGAGRTVEGASTITQQLVKNTHLSAERTLERKLKEIAIAAKIEQNYSKDEILSMYLSVIYFGSGAYGIKEASRVYFGCAPEELTVAQAATLAGILKNPAEYSPKNHPENAVARRDLVLDVMYREGCLTAAERDEAKAEELVLAETPEERDPAARYVAEAVREACELLGITEYELGNSGLTVLTAYDPSAQSALVRETENAAVYSSPEVDGEAVLIDNATGEIVAYHNTTGYEVRRQAGSAMKPLAVYAPALDAGVITLATPVRDELTDFGGWQPQNFGGKPSRRHHSPRGVETLRQHRRGQSALLSRRGTSRGEVPHARAAADLGGRKPRPRARLHPKGGEPRGACGSVFRPRAGRQFHRAAFRARRGEGRGARRGAPQHRNKSVLPRCFGTRHGLPCRHRTRRHRPHTLLSPSKSRQRRVPWSAPTASTLTLGA